MAPSLQRATGTPRRCGPPRRGRGFSLIEFVAVMTIVAIFSAIAAPSYRTMLLNRRANAIVSAMTDSLWTARSEALKRNADVQFVITNVANGWDIVQGATVLRSQEGFPDVALTPTARTYTFNPYGRLSAGGGTALSVAVGGSVYRCVTVTSVGRVTTTKAACP
jgi:type IV fimbrial biogenesis protein FimT